MKRLLLACAAFGAWALCAAPSHAGSFGFYGSYWDTQDADYGWGGGIRTSFGQAVQFDLRGTYYHDLKRDVGPDDIELHASPLDAGISFHFLNTSPVHPYIGGGASYFLLDSDRGKVNDELGFYGLGGLEFGHRDSGPRFFVEAAYREVHATVHRKEGELPDISSDVRLQLRGFSANAGVLWHF